MAEIAYPFLWLFCIRENIPVMLLVDIFNAV